MPTHVNGDRRTLLQGAAATAVLGLSGCQAVSGPAGRAPIASEFERATATELARALRRRSISATELCLAAIARIERFDRQVNAVIVRDFGRALDDARAADEALARRDARPLLGVPATVKEAFDLEGCPTTFGLEEMGQSLPA